MPRPLHKLAPRAVLMTSAPGRYGDGGGLYLVVSPSGSRKWVFRFRWKKRLSDMGLGSASVVMDSVEGSERRRIVFSGDIGRAGLPIIRDPHPPMGGADVVLLGWVHRVRDLGGVTFIDIRDRAGLSQLVVRENDALMAVTKRLRPEFVIGVRGIVQHRSEDAIGRRCARRFRLR